MLTFNWLSCYQHSIFYATRLALCTKRSMFWNIMFIVTITIAKTIWIHFPYSYVFCLNITLKTSIHSCEMYLLIFDGAKIDLFDACSLSSATQACDLTYMNHSSNTHIWLNQERLSHMTCRVQCLCWFRLVWQRTNILFQFHRINVFFQSESK